MSSCPKRLLLLLLFAFPGLVAHGSSSNASQTRQWIDRQVSVVAVQPDQRIMVGTQGAYVYCLDEASGTIQRRLGGLFRLHRDGSIDESFQSRMSAIGYLKIAPDGRLFVAGALNDDSRVPSGYYAFLHPGGAMDDSFQPYRNVPNRPTHRSVSWWPHASLHSVALEKSGRLAIPPLNESGLPTGLFTRLDGHGNLLPIPEGEIPHELRSGSGLVARSIGELPDLARRVFAEMPVELCRYVFELPDGGTILWAWIEGQPQLRRFDGDWRLDGGFGAILQFPRPARGQSVRPNISIVQQPDGRLVVGGNFVSVNGTPSSGLVRLHPDGTLDDTFNCVLVHESGWRGLHVALQEDGRILVGGNVVNINGTDCRYFARLNPDGSLDGDFQARFLSGDTDVPARFYAISLRGSSAAAGSSASPAPSAEVVTGSSDARRVVWIEALRFDSSGIGIIRFTGEPRQQYLLQTSDQLDSGVWTTVATGLTDEEGGGLLRDTGTVGNPTRFYRLAVP